MKHVQTKSKEITAKDLKHKIKKRNRGITLIALVITIIVLLILAGVSIATLTGENGILTQAKKAKEETRGASVQEAIDLWEISKEADDVAGTSAAQSQADLLANLLAQNLITEDEKVLLEAGETIKIGSRSIQLTAVGPTLVEMFKAAQEEGCTGCSNTEEHLHIGDYLEYKPDTTKSAITLGEAETGYDAEQVYKVDTTTTWRVLGLDEEEDNLLLISGSPIKKDDESDPYLVLQGAESYIMCEYTLDKICSLYETEYSEDVRSVRIEDINLALGLTVDEENKKMYKTADSNETALEAFDSSYLGQTYTYVANSSVAPENYVKNKYASDTTISSGIKSLIDKLTLKTSADSVIGTAYGYSYTDTNVVDAESTIYEVLFDDTLETDKYAKSYWLASPGAFAFPGEFAGFGPGGVGGGFARRGGYLFDSYGYWYANGLGVRPVVSLKSDITMSEIGIDVDGAEVEWNIDNSDARGSGSLTEEEATWGLITE